MAMGLAIMIYGAWDYSQSLSAVAGFF